MSKKPVIAARRIAADLALIERNDAEVAAKTAQTREAWWRIFQALAEQRDRMSSTNAFNAWVVANNLNQGLLRHNTVRSDAIYCWRNRVALKCLNTAAVHPTALRRAFEFAYPKRWDSREKRKACRLEARRAFVRDKDGYDLSDWLKRAFPPSLLAPITELKRAGEQQTFLASWAADDMKLPRSFVARIRQLQVESAAALAAIEQYLASGRPLRRSTEEISEALRQDSLERVREAAAQASLAPDAFEVHFDEAVGHDHPRIVAPEAWAVARATVRAALDSMRPAIVARRLREKKAELRRMCTGFFSPERVELKKLEQLEEDLRRRYGDTPAYSSKLWEALDRWDAQQEN